MRPAQIGSRGCRFRVTAAAPQCRGRRFRSLSCAPWLRRVGRCRCIHAQSWLHQPRRLPDDEAARFPCVKVIGNLLQVQALPSLQETPTGRWRQMANLSEVVMSDDYGCRRARKGSMVRPVAVLAVALLAACGTASRTVALDPLVGQSDQVVEQRIGPPTRTLDEGGNQILVYEQGTVQWVPPGYQEIYLPYRGTESAGRPQNVAGRGCETRFVSQAGIVRSITFNGSSC